MDEPTSGLDARAAAIVMRTVRNTVNTGRTVLLLMMRGGQVIYAGPLGHHSADLIEYFEAIPGVKKITEGCNPATWMLEITSASVEAQLSLDFAEVYGSSFLHQIKDISFSTKYAQSFITQWLASFWKQHWSYWRDPHYNAMRFFTTIITGVLFGTIFWNKFNKLNKEQEVFNILGALYGSVFFLGATNCNTVQPVIAIERAVFYRETAAGMYSPLSYAFAQWRLPPGFKIAAIVSFFFFSLWNLFSGFLIFRPLIPIWWRWYYWATPLAWTIYGLAASQLGNLDNLVEIPGQSSRPLNEFLSHNLGYDIVFSVMWH
ncbi:putative ABC-2 type transporter, P-loop containing nucleoside triphosphate hydrolase [Dioscorea sansibarensis]